MSTLIGTAPDQVPVNGMLGDMAFQSKSAVTIGTLTSNGTTSTDLPTYSSEFITSSASWTTSTGWTGDNTTGWVHATGNSGTLTYPTAAVSGTRYQIAYTVTSYSAGSFTVTFGGQSNATIIATGTFGPTATSTGNLVITPTSDFVGTIIISIKSLTAVSTPVISLKDSTNTVRFEARVNSSLYNTFLGVNTGSYNTTGYQNSAVGSYALTANTTGNYNSAVGASALQLNTTGNYNSAFGASALGSNTTGVLNNAFGYVSLGANTTGSSNNAFGRGSLQINTTGGNNNAFGRNTLQANVTSSGSCAFGDLALTLSTGALNSAFGYGAGSGITSGANNVVIGGYTGAAAPISATGSNYIVLSDGAGNVRQVIDSSGRVGIGGTPTAVALEVISTGAILVAKGTTAQQPTGVAGYLRFNTTTTQFEGHNGTAWASVGGSAITNDTTTSTNIYPLCASATSGTALNVYTSNTKYLYKPSTGELSSPEVIATNGFHLNSSAIATSYTVAVGTNAMSVGPITVNSGVVITVSSGQRWVVL